MAEGRLRNQRGLTLVELAIAVSIVAILATLGIPSIIRMMPRINLSNETTSLSNEIVLARTRAIAKNRLFLVQFSTSQNSYTLQFWNDADNDGLIDSGEVTGFATNTLSRDVDLYQVDTLDAANRQLAIRAVGSVGKVTAGAFVELTTPARFYLQTCEAGDANNDGACDSPGAHFRRVNVEPTGRVHVEFSTDGASWAEY